MGITKRITNLADEQNKAPDRVIIKNKKVAHRRRAPVQQKKLMSRWRLDQGNTVGNINDDESSQDSALESANHNHGIPISLGDAFADSLDTIKTINSPHIRSIGSLWYWLHADPTDAPGGCFRAMKSAWANLMFQQGPCEPPYIGITMYFALRRLGQLTSVNTDKYAIRAKGLTLQALQNYDRVAPCLLVIIGNLALVAMAEGDIASAKTHWKALASFSDCKVENPAAWFNVNGLDVRFAGNLMVKPALPYHIPKALRVPLALPAQDLARGSRLGSSNALAFVNLLGEDYLKVQHLFVNVHHLITVSNMSIDLDRNPIFGHIYDTIFHSTTLVATYKEDGVSATARYREILAITISLVFWGAVAGLIPQEGVIQFNLVQRASDIVRLNRTVFVKKWLNLAEVKGVIWVIINISLQAWIWRPDDLPLWAGILKETLRKHSVKDVDLRAYAEEWPYIAAWLDMIDYDPWKVIKLADELSKGELIRAAPKPSLLL